MMIESEVEKKLKALAVRTNVNMSEHIRKALDVYLETESDQEYSMTQEYKDVVMLLELLRIVYF